MENLSAPRLALELVTMARHRSVQMSRPGSPGVGRSEETVVSGPNHRGQVIKVKVTAFHYSPKDQGSVLILDVQGGNTYYVGITLDPSLNLGLYGRMDLVEGPRGGTRYWGDQTRRQFFADMAAIGLEQSYALI